MAETVGQFVVKSLCAFCDEVHLYKRSCCPFHFGYAYDGTDHAARELGKVLTQQLQFGRSEPGSVDGPLFEQPGLFD